MEPTATYPHTDLHTDPGASLPNRLNRLMQTTRIYTTPGITRRRVASLLYTNEMYLHLTLRRYYGCPFSVYIARLRMQLAMQMLTDPACRELTITDIALDAGYGSRFTFYRQFKARTGMTPQEYRRMNNTYNI